MKDFKEACFNLARVALAIGGLFYMFYALIHGGPVEPGWMGY